MSVSMTLPRKRALWGISILTLTLMIGCQIHESPPLDRQSDNSDAKTRVINLEPVSDSTHRMETAFGLLIDELDLTDGITLAEGEALAMRFNPDLRVDRLKADLELATRESSGLQNESALGLDGDEPLSPWTTPFDFGAIDSLTLPVPSRLDVENDRAGALLERQRRKVVDAEWRIRHVVRKRWSAWSTAMADRELMNELIRELEEIEDLAKKLRNMEELNRVEHRLLKIEVAERKLQITKIDLRIIEARADLLEAMGLPPEAGDVLVPGFPNATIPIIDDLASRLIENNTTLSFEFAIYQLAQSKEERDVARATAVTTFERLFQTLIAEKRALDLTSKQLEDYRATVVPLLSNQRKDIRRITELGEVDVFILLKTAIRRVNARLELVDLQARRTDAAISIGEILGPDSGEFTPPVQNDDNEDDSDTQGTGSTVYGAGQ